MNIKVKIESLDNYGRGIAHIDGKVVFVYNALPDELVSIQVTNDKKKYAEAKVINYLETSKKRITSPCPYYKICGGCQLGHIKYEDQLVYKKEKLLDIFEKKLNKKYDIEIIASDNDYNYRNKITLKIVNSKWGYYSEKTHDFIAIETCLLAINEINKVIKNQNLFNVDSGEIIIRVNYNEEILIGITTDKNYNIDVEMLRKKIKLVGIIVNEKIIYGKSFFIEIIDNKFYQVSINSFFQVNKNILAKVFEILNQKKYKTLVDLYCGVGTLGIAVHKEKLYGIEINKDAIIKALTNVKMNAQLNCNFLIGDSIQISKIMTPINTLIIDPPRSGLSPNVIDDINKKNISEIIYMSCNPITLVNDLKLLSYKYDIKHIYLLDMFPNTYHIESIIILNLIK